MSKLERTSGPKSTEFVLRLPPLSAGGNSAGGVYANSFYLGGERANQVNPGGSLQLSTDGVKAEYTGGVMTMLFTLTLASGQYPTSSVLFARGGAGDPSSGAIPEHTQYYQGRLTWQVRLG